MSLPPEAYQYALAVAGPNAGAFAAALRAWQAGARAGGASSDRVTASPGFTGDPADGAPTARRVRAGTAGKAPVRTPGRRWAIDRQIRRRSYARAVHRIALGLYRCGECREAMDIDAIRATRRYCSAACRQAAWRRR
jgi:hypothetical protein